ncbi:MULTISPECIES: tRNA (guanosine(37)-N1)-methyltransferase TrmD [Aerococcus]|uniref:tRNA (guanosine(37)-N1)-methyltransferase TrmD n=1 Tax=Aerococcus TaxID=1375 RepID=UPI0018A6EBE1|nr:MULTISPECIES: tRNA (guanosine(37)-N1)-methyltransferase TrmD [Aerococcus]MCY3035243.1 tRNA (guanosine(37)-N1)-methyltransferase TrmD [Aerococcus sp. Group 2]MCY3038666.1 tRNA (guanosine(37)-N1)-methyltransferase TrmD [Aerococcus sp. Group 2]MCY3040821.1 tRNA (guanosine(37)-N1)-methyltransferase TrmD [Aerococcus sp. Group 2]MCY3042058.1 tRNA (guanosine(37)-N1)-methyltransferase TrmD [Aerococcus sp. Group 2]MDK6521054.1 tRNA (guanosine(37)-N1)-methyltransferase TrmD [Aerococcus urinae]
MKVNILSLFPDMFTGPMNQSIIGKAQEKGLVDIEVTDFRQFANNKHGHVDDYPFGGGAGMLLQVGPIYRALEAIDPLLVSEDLSQRPASRVILMDPAGQRFNQAKAEELAQEDQLIFICGHYEGYDERIRNYVTDEISIGDFVLTGGELGAMTVIDATVRLLDEAVGNNESVEVESFSTGLLEYPQYTRPRSFMGMDVPDVLVSGDHQKIADWKGKEAIRRTYLRRPDLLDQAELTDQEKQWLLEIQAENPK